jgi:hypothetical protein
MEDGQLVDEVMERVQNADKDWSTANSQKVRLEVVALCVRQDPNFADSRRGHSDCSPRLPPNDAINRIWFLTTQQRIKKYNSFKK